MHPIYITVGARLPLIIIPDGHPALTDTYEIYYHRQNSGSTGIHDSPNYFTCKKQYHPDYLGLLIFEVPDKLFIYRAGENEHINSDEVEEAIELIYHYREAPELWPSS